MSSPEKPPWASMSDKAKGEWVEVVFMAKVGALGLSISKPHGDNEQFDFIVCDRAGKPVRVQVKSAWTQTSLGYRIQHRRFGDGRPLGYDVLVAYIPPLDAWYVIPVSELPHSYITHLWPHSRRPSRSKWEPYRNAWHILSGDPDDDTRSLGLTIHAAADDGKSSKLP
ncbi:MAG TPA: group I intron-associated PD-(D/E)XK endonuclease [Terriglobales bacterium]|nr:group I intron-associated PD-(D/E)XK endonuclease [Terriglobales bacterium]